MNKASNWIFSGCILLFIGLFGSGCSLTKSLPEGAELYQGAKVKIIPADQKSQVEKLSASYESIISKPKPNKRFLGVYWRLRWYNFFRSKKQKGLRPWLQKKLGRPPVIFDPQITGQVEKLLENRAFNQGFFGVKAESIIQRKGRKVKVEYQVKLNQPYLIQSYQSAIQDSLVNAAVRKNISQSLVQPGQAYDLDVLKSERGRISTDLRQQGFYFFRSSDLLFKADSNITGNQIKLRLELKPNVDTNHLLPQIIDSIIVYSTFEVNQSVSRQQDTTHYEGLTIISQRDWLKYRVLRNAITLKSGMAYSPKVHQQTSERLAFLKNHQFIDIRFLPTGEAGRLRVVIKLSPRKREAIEGSVGLSLKSRLYLGPEISLSYLNRNLFGGAEQIRITAKGNYNFPLDPLIASFQEQGIKVEVSKPGLIIPFKRSSWSNQLIAKTKALFNYTSERIRLPLQGAEEFLESENLTALLQRLQQDSTFAPFIAFNTFELELGYQWRKQIHVQQELVPIKLTLQNPRYEIEELRRFLLLINALGDSQEGVLLNLERMLILQPSYTFLYDSRLRRRKTHNFFYRGKTIYAENRLLETDAAIRSSLLESRFFQLENDFRYYWRITEKQTIGLRLATNVSIPLKDEVVLPFFDLYSIGGPNSVRAFQPRQVGPGSIAPSNDAFFFSGIGDVLLEGTLEWRPKLNKLMELGFFLDAGNVWLFDGDDSNVQEAVFDFSQFYRQLALGTGFGLRFDFELLILRFDFALPLTKPWLPEGERWVGDEIQLGSSSWLFDNVTFNLGFGYSF